MMKHKITIFVLYVCALLIFFPSLSYSQSALISGNLSLTSSSQDTELNNQTVTSQNTTFQYDASYSMFFGKSIALGIESNYAYNSGGDSSLSSFGLGAIGYYFITRLKPASLAPFVFSGVGFNNTDLADDRKGVTFFNLAMGVGGHVSH